MKRFLTTAKVKTTVHLLALCAVAVLAIPGEAYAFDAKDVPVLMYHKVDDVAPTTYWVSTDSFRDQMFLLHDLGYETVDLDDLYNHIQDVTELPAKPIIVTFDDAYENAYTHALPLVSEQGFIGVGDIGPTDYISYTDPNRQENLWDQPPEPTAWHLIWSEVNALYTAGWGIVAHSKTHGQLADMNIAEEVDSRNIIASEASIPVPNFYGYPFGQSSSELITALQNEGYLGAMDASGGIENTGTTDLWHIKRTGIMRDDTLAQFATKIGESLPTIYRLTVNTVGNGSVDINPDRPFYYYDNEVTLTAIADPFYEFDSWSDDLTGNNNPNTITIDSDKTVTANFVFEGVDTILLDDGFEVDFANWDENGTTDWDKATDQKNSGSYSAHCGPEQNDLISDSFDTSSAWNVTVSFWYHDHRIDDDDDVYLQFWNGSDYVDIYELGNSPEDTWHYYSVTIDAPEYLRADFSIKFEGTSIDPGGGPNSEHLWIDDVSIKKTMSIYDLVPDGFIDFADLDVFTAAWPSISGDGNWNAACDFYTDLKIDFKDFAKFALVWGEL